MKYQKERVSALLFAAISTISIMGLIFILHEQSKEFREFLIGLTGHHWTSVSIISLLLFMVLSLVFSALMKSEHCKARVKTISIQHLAWILTAITVIMILSTVFLYTMHYITG